MTRKGWKGMGYFISGHHQLLSSRPQFKKKCEVYVSKHLSRSRIRQHSWRVTVHTPNKHLHQCCLFRVMAEELTNARAALQRQTREAQGAIQDLLSEREEFSRDMVLTHR